MSDEISPDEPGIEMVDVSSLDRWLADPEAPLAELVAKLPFLRSEHQARELLDGIRRSIEDVRCGRTVPHEQVVRDAEARRRRFRVRYQASAAE